MSYSYHDSNQNVWRTPASREHGLESNFSLPTQYPIYSNASENTAMNGVRSLPYQHPSMLFTSPGYQQTSYSDRQSQLFAEEVPDSTSVTVASNIDTGPRVYQGISNQASATRDGCEVIHSVDDASGYLSNTRDSNLLPSSASFIPGGRDLNPSQVDSGGYPTNSFITYPLQASAPYSQMGNHSRRISESSGTRNLEPGQQKKTESWLIAKFLDSVHSSENQPNTCSIPTSDSAQHPQTISVNFPADSRPRPAAQSFVGRYSKDPGASAAGDLEKITPRENPSYCWRPPPSNIATWNTSPKNGEKLVTSSKMKQEEILPRKESGVDSGSLGAWTEYFRQLYLFNVINHQHGEAQPQNVQGDEVATNLPVDPHRPFTKLGYSMNRGAAPVTNMPGGSQLQKPLVSASGSRELAAEFPKYVSSEDHRKRYKKQTFHLDSTIDPQYPRSLQVCCRMCNLTITESFSMHNRRPEHLERKALIQRGCLLCKLSNFQCYKEYAIHMNGKEHKENQMKSHLQDGSAAKNTDSSLNVVDSTQDKSTNPDSSGSPVVTQKKRISQMITKSEKMIRTAFQPNAPQKPKIEIKLSSRQPLLAADRTKAGLGRKIPERSLAGNKRMAEKLNPSEVVTVEDSTGEELQKRLKIGDVVGPSVGSLPIFPAHANAAEESRIQISSLDNLQMVENAAAAADELSSNSLKDANTATVVQVEGSVLECNTDIAKPCKVAEAEEQNALLPALLLEVDVGLGSSSKEGSAELSNRSLLNKQSEDVFVAVVGFYCKACKTIYNRDDISEDQHRQSETHQTNLQAVGHLPLSSSHEPFSSLPLPDIEAKQPQQNAESEVNMPKENVTDTSKDADEAHKEVKALERHGSTADHHQHLVSQLEDGTSSQNLVCINADLNSHDSARLGDDLGKHGTSKSSGLSENSAQISTPIQLEDESSKKLKVANGSDRIVQQQKTDDNELRPPDLETMGNTAPKQGLGKRKLILPKSCMKRRILEENSKDVQKKMEDILEEVVSREVARNTQTERQEDEKKVQTGNEELQVRSSVSKKKPFVIARTGKLVYAGSTAGGRSNTGSTAAGRSDTESTAAGRSETGNTAVVRSDTESTAVGRSETGNTAVVRSDTESTAVGRSETGNTAAGRSDTESTAAGRSNTESTAAGRSDTRNTSVGRSDTGNTAAGQSDIITLVTVKEEPPETDSSMKLTTVKETQAKRIETVGRNLRANRPGLQTHFPGTSDTPQLNENTNCSSINVSSAKQETTTTEESASQGDTLHKTILPKSVNDSHSNELSSEMESKENNATTELTEKSAVPARNVNDSITENSVALLPDKNPVIKPSSATVINPGVKLNSAAVTKAGRDFNVDVKNMSNINQQPVGKIASEAKKLDNVKTLTINNSANSDKAVTSDKDITHNKTIRTGIKACAKTVANDMSGASEFKSVAIYKTVAERKTLTNQETAAHDKTQPSNKGTAISTGAGQIANEDGATQKNIVPALTMSTADGRVATKDRTTQKNIVPALTMSTADGRVATKDRTTQKNIVPALTISPADRKVATKDGTTQKNIVQAVSVSTAKAKTNSPTVSIKNDKRINSCLSSASEDCQTDGKIATKDGTTQKNILPAVRVPAVDGKIATKDGTTQKNIVPAVSISTADSKVAIKDGTTQKNILPAVSISTVDRKVAIKDGTTQKNILPAVSISTVDRKVATKDGTTEKNIVPAVSISTVDGRVAIKDGTTQKNIVPAFSGSTVDGRVATKDCTTQNNTVPAVSISTVDGKIATKDGTTQKNTMPAVSISTADGKIATKDGTTQKNTVPAVSVSTAKYSTTQKNIVPAVSVSTADGKVATNDGTTQKNIVPAVSISTVDGKIATKDGTTQKNTVPTVSISTADGKVATKDGTTQKNIVPAVSVSTVDGRVANKDGTTQKNIVPAVTISTTKYSTTQKNIVPAVSVSTVDGRVANKDGTTQKNIVPAVTISIDDGKVATKDGTTQKNIVPAISVSTVATKDGTTQKNIVPAVSVSTTKFSTTQKNIVPAVSVSTVDGRVANKDGTTQKNIVPAVTISTTKYSTTQKNIVPAISVSTVATKDGTTQKNIVLAAACNRSVVVKEFADRTVVENKACKTTAGQLAGSKAGNITVITVNTAQSASNHKNAANISESKTQDAKAKTNSPTVSIKNDKRINNGLSSASEDCQTDSKSQFADKKRVVSSREALELVDCSENSSSSINAKSEVSNVIIPASLEKGCAVS